MSRARRSIACLSAASTGPELMAQASVALRALARVHRLELEQLHAPFGGLAYAHVAQRMPRTTLAAVLGSDAVLVAGPEDIALDDVFAELDLRARVSHVRFGASHDVAFVTPMTEASQEWALKRAFAIAESRTLRLALVGEGSWREAAEPISAAVDYVSVEHLTIREAMRYAASDASRFDVVAVESSSAKPLVDIAAAAIERRVIAHAFLAEHGPSAFMPSSDGGSTLAGHGVVNPSSMLLAAALTLHYGLDEPFAAATLAGSVSAALVHGPVTPDLVRRGVGTTTTEFTERVVAGLDMANRSAEFLPAFA